jgi:hypothetical protein
VLVRMQYYAQLQLQLPPKLSLYSPLPNSTVIQERHTNRELARWLTLWLRLPLDLWGLVLKFGWRGKTKRGAELDVIVRYERLIRIIDEANQRMPDHRQGV